jgi:putative aldouronate transport system substrate-binding protein
MGMFRNIREDLADYPALRDSVLNSAWEAAAVGDGIYAIPHMKDIAAEVFWILDEDYFLNQKGFPKETRISFREIEPYLEAFKEDYPDDYPIKMAYGGLVSWQNALVDWLNMTYLIGLDWDAQGTDQEYVVKSALEIPAWRERLRILHEWYQKGYINRDAAVCESMPRSQAGVVQSGQGWFGAESIWANAVRRSVYIAVSDGPRMGTSSVRGAMTAVSSFSPHWREALALIQLMNTDPWYRETARYGIEGKHYVRNADGTVTRTPEGVSSMGVQAYTQGHYTLGALEASSFPQIAVDPLQWQKAMKHYETAQASSVMGFAPDISPVESECLAIRQIIGEYSRELYTGTSDPDTVIPVMLERMKAAGLDRVLAEFQRQLDAFRAASPDASKLK